MSLLIKIEKFGSTPRLLHTRQPHLRLGEGRKFGLLSYSDLTDAFFCITATPLGYILEVENPDFSINTGEALSGRAAPLKAGDMLEGRDYRFTFVPISETAELLAYSSALPCVQALVLANQRGASLAYRVAGIRRRYPIPPNLDIVIGSSPGAAVFIPLSGIKEAHCAVSLQRAALKCEAIRGIVRHVDGRSFSRAQFRSSASIVLEPVGLRLDLIMENAQ